MDIHKDLEGITNVALHYANEHNCNYSIIISNPVEGKFNNIRSTYEYVGDSYFHKVRDCIIVTTTDKLISDTIIESEFEISDSMIARMQHSINNSPRLDREIAENLRTRNNSDPFILDESYKIGGYRGHRERIEPRRVPKVPGRNDKCSCGSNKKYKKCCNDRV